MTSFKFLLLAAGLAFVNSGHAVPVTYTDPVAFFGDLPGAASVLDFEGLADGTIIADGSTVGGITFRYDFGGVQMMVTDAFDTTSPVNSLGTDDGDVFLDGDDFDLVFDAASAIGLFFITSPDENFDEDILLTAGGATANLIASDLIETLPDGGEVFFLGIIDAMSTFTSASITTVGGGFFLYNVDDIVIGEAAAVAPVAGSLWLFGLGLAGFLPTVRRLFNS